MDTSDLVTCPYDSSHRIRKKRFQFHLTKCQKNHSSSKKVICPLNSSHIIDKDDLAEHMTTCSNVPDLMRFQETLNSIKSTPNTNIDMPCSSEDWDSEPVSTSSYNAMENSAKRNVLRCVTGLSKSEKIQFKNAERIRLANITGINTKSIEISSKEKEDEAPVRSPRSPHVTQTVQCLKTIQADFSEQMSKLNINTQMNIPIDNDLDNLLDTTRSNISPRKSTESSTNSNDTSTDKKSKERQRDSITEINTFPQISGLNTNLNNLNKKLNIKNIPKERINDNSPRMSNSSPIEIIDEMSSTDKSDFISKILAYQLNHHLAVLSRIERHIAKEKLKIIDKLKELELLHKNSPTMLLQILGDKKSSHNPCSVSESSDDDIES